jgi:hypothetical protein
MEFESVLMGSEACISKVGHKHQCEQADEQNEFRSESDDEAFAKWLYAFHG